MGHKTNWIAREAGATASGGGVGETRPRWRNGRDGHILHFACQNFLSGGTAEVIVIRRFSPSPAAGGDVVSMEGEGKSPVESEPTSQLVDDRRQVRLVNTLYSSDAHSSGLMSHFRHRLVQ